MKKVITFIIISATLLIVSLPTVYASSASLRYTYSGSWRNGFHANYMIFGTSKYVAGNYNAVDYNSGSVTPYYSFSSPRTTGPIDYIKKISEFEMYHVSCDFIVSGSPTVHLSL